MVVTGESLIRGTYAGNRLDCHAYPRVAVATRNRQNRRVHHPHYGRLTPGVCCLGNALFPVWFQAGTNSGRAFAAHRTRTKR